MSLPPSVGKTVLITGITGYIASVLGLHVLSKGYNLRGTTRSRYNAAALLDYAYKDYASRVEILEIEDITVPGAFNEAVNGVFVIHHIALPMDSGLQDWDARVPPAIKSCIEILKSASTYAGPQLESVIFLSSAAVTTDPRHPRRSDRTESDWYEYVEAVRQEMGPQAASNLLYQAAKSLAEAAVWRFKDENQPKFSITSINPSVVTGPPVQPPPTVSTLSTTLRPIWEMFSGKAAIVPPGFGTNGYVDVRDVAKIHIWCMEHPTQSANQRYLASAGLGPPQAVVDILRRAYPEREDIIPRGEPGKGYLPDFKFFREGGRHYGTQASEAVGMQYIPYDQSILETARVLERYLEV